MAGVFRRFFRYVPKRRFVRTETAPVVVPGGVAPLVNSGLVNRGLVNGGLVN